MLPVTSEAYRIRKSLTRVFFEQETVGNKKTGLPESRPVKRQGLRRAKT
jgi:hypothetical protein